MGPVDNLGLPAHSFNEHEDNIELREIPSIGKKLQISWHDVKISAVPKGRCCKGPDFSKKKEILKGISGSVLPGQFVSILGASGAGKTTFLNHISGRLTSKNLIIEGDVRINGTNVDEIDGFSAFSAYIQQDDVLFQAMTVRECLEFSAKMKLKGGHEMQQKRVDEIIQDLKLKKCQNTMIGGPLIKGVSGGERKRTSIGVELITNPSLIFLDEPTTGLDSYTAT